MNTACNLAGRTQSHAPPLTTSLCAADDIFCAADGVGAGLAGGRPATTCSVANCCSTRPGVRPRCRRASCRGAWLSRLRTPRRSGSWSRRSASSSAGRPRRRRRGPRRVADAATTGLTSWTYGSGARQLLLAASLISGISSSRTWYGPSMLSRSTSPLVSAADVGLTAEAERADLTRREARVLEPEHDIADVLPALHQVLVDVDVLHRPQSARARSARQHAALRSRFGPYVTR